MNDPFPFSNLEFRVEALGFLSAMGPRTRFLLMRADADRVEGIGGV